MMKRRSLIGAMGGGLWVASPFGYAQSARKVYRIGTLGVGYAAADMAGPQPRSAPAHALVLGLRELGYVYGEHFVTEARSSQGQAERYAALIAELARLQVDVIVAAGPALAALKRAALPIPVVMAGAEDPVGLGVVKNLAQPGGNFTGLSNLAVELSVKKIELLKEIVPGAAPVAVLWDSESLLGWSWPRARYPLPRRESCFLYPRRKVHARSTAPPVCSCPGPGLAAFILPR